MKAVIIAGGKGKRLNSLTSGVVPKAMASLGGKPVLEYQINLLRRYGITDIYILIGYLGHIIEDYFGDGKFFGVNITYSLEDKPLGTAGCVKVLENEIRDNFIVVYGDIMLSMKIDDLVDFHTVQKGVATLAVHPNDHHYDSDHVVIDNDCRITDFLLKDQKPRYYNNLVSAAVYILSPTVFHYIPEDVSTDFVKDIFPEMIGHHEKIYGYKTAEYIKDIGTVYRFERVSRDFESGKIGKSSKVNERPAIFIDRDGTLVKDVKLLHQTEYLELFPFAGSAVKKINNSDFLSFLITNQPVVAHNLCDISTVKEIHNKLETLLGVECAYLNDIYFCPHHPDIGYPGENKDYKIDCHCRKPKTGMIDQAVKEYNIDVDSSWFIGDTTVDIQTGINAGLKTILVRTGKEGKDRKYQCTPDFEFDNLERATDFILEKKGLYNLYIDVIINEIDSWRYHFPFTISVGGMARSGKSTFVKLLIQSLQKHGTSSQVLSLDNWLLNNNERTDHMTVRERYKYNEITRDMKRIMSGEEILLKKYDTYSRAIIGEEPFSLNDSKCLIVEGVPALDIGGLKDLSNLKAFVQIDEDVRKERVFSFYRWKDLSDEEIKDIYQKRLENEAPFIQESKKYADIIVEV